MSDLSPKERAFLESVKREWGPSAETAAAVKRAIAERAGESTELVDDAPRPAKAPARSLWTLGAGVAFVGLCIAGLVWERASSRHVVAQPPAVVATAPAPIVTTAPAVEAPRVPDALPLEALPDSPREPSVAPKGSGAHAPAPRASGATDTLGEELALLHTAQSAMRDGKADEALSALATHAARFPKGVLREERMTLQVLALCDRGEVARARAVRDELAALAPGSSHLRRLDNSCASR